MNTSRKPNYCDELLHEIITASNDTQLVDSFKETFQTVAKTIASVNEILQGMYAESNDVDEQTNEPGEKENAPAPAKNEEQVEQKERAKLGEYVAPKVEVKNDFDPYCESYISTTHIADFAYDKDPLKSDKFVMDHLDNTIFRIFSVSSNMNSKNTTIREEFVFQGNEKYVFEWNWDEEAFVLVDPETTDKPKYNNYQRKFVPFAEPIVKVNEVRAKEEYINKRRIKLQNADREEIAEEVERIIDVYDIDAETAPSEVTFDKIFTDDDVLDVVDASLRNVNEDNIYLKDHRVVGVKFSEFSLLRDLSVKQATKLAVGETYDASDIFTANRCKLIAKTFRFSRVIFDGELKLEF